ncbi:MAG: hypothetical protein WC485_00115 [Opitutaceae bacterium]
MANEVELERLVVRLIGEGESYLAMMNDAKTQAQQSVNAIESELSRLNNNHPLDSVKESMADAAAISSDTAAPALEDLNAHENALAASGQNLSRAHRAVGHGLQMLGVAVGQVNAGMGESLVSMGEAVRYVSAAEHAYHGLERSLISVVSSAYTPLAFVALPAIAAGFALWEDHTNTIKAAQEQLKDELAKVNEEIERQTRLAGAAGHVTSLGKGGKPNRTVEASDADAYAKAAQAEFDKAADAAYAQQQKVEAIKANIARGNPWDTDFRREQLGSKDPTGTRSTGLYKELEDAEKNLAKAEQARKDAGDLAVTTAQQASIADQLRRQADFSEQAAEAEARRLELVGLTELANQRELKARENELSLIGLTGEEAARQRAKAQAELDNWAADEEARIKRTRPLPHKDAGALGDIAAATAAARAEQEALAESQRESESLMSDLESQGASVYADTRTELEKYNDEMERLGTLLVFDAISSETYDRAVQALNESLEETKEAKNAVNNIRVRGDDVGSILTSFWQHQRSVANANLPRSMPTTAEPAFEISGHTSSADQYWQMTHANQERNAHPELEYDPIQGAKYLQEDSSEKDEMKNEVKQQTVALTKLLGIAQDYWTGSAVTIEPSELS